MSANLALPAPPEQVTARLRLTAAQAGETPGLGDGPADAAAAERRAAANRELREKAMDVRVHTVFRKEGRIVALQWQDGSVEISDRSALSAWSRTRAVTHDSGLTPEQAVDAYAAELERNLREGLTVERYDAQDNAPTRRDYEMGRLFTDADLRAGRRLDISA